MSDVIEFRGTAASLVRWRAAAYWELTKPRIAAMVLVATAIGFLLALPAEADLVVFPLLVHTLVGTALVGGAANALNQFVEAKWDGQMARTANRPLPSGRLTGAEAVTFGVACAVVGVAYLSLLVGLPAGLLAAAALASYLFVYTPLKRATSMCVPVGAVSGALPPVIGWAAATGSLSTGAWVLFSILFFWQLPHFAAIAWLYREDYGRAGFPMLPVIDPAGRRTSRHVVVHSVGLLTASLLPALLGFAGGAYAVCALLLGSAFLACGIVFITHKTKDTARMHLLASVIYLPLLFAAMLVDKMAWF